MPKKKGSKKSVISWIIVVVVVLAALRSFAPAYAGDDCHTTTFDDLATGEIVADQIPGLTVSSDDADHLPMIFDTGAPTGDDWDLGTPNEDFGGPGRGLGGRAGQPGENSVFLGNAVILSEDNDADDPDDHRDGGVLTFVFDSPVTVEDVTLLDIDEDNTARIRLETSGGDIFFDALWLGNNSAQTLIMRVPNVSALHIDFAGSGALPQLSYCEPATAVGLQSATAGQEDSGWVRTAFVALFVLTGLALVDARSGRQRFEWLIG